MEHFREVQYGNGCQRPFYVAHYWNSETEVKEKNVLQTKISNYDGGRLANYFDNRVDLDWLG